MYIWFMDTFNKKELNQQKIAFEEYVFFMATLPM